MAPLRTLGLQVLRGWVEHAEEADLQLQATDSSAQVRAKKTTWHCGYGTFEVTERVWRGQAGAWQRPFATNAALSARGSSRRLQRLASDFALEEPFGRAAARLLEHHGVTLAPSTMRAITLAHATALRQRQLARPAVRTLPPAGAAALIVETDGTLLPQVEFAPGPGDRRKLRKVAYRETRLLAAQASGQTRTYYAISCGDLTETCYRPECRRRKCRD